MEKISKSEKKLCKSSKLKPNKQIKSTQIEETLESDSDPMEKRKLVLVGDSKCGKTCLVKAWMAAGPCQEIHEPTVFDNYSTTVRLWNRRRRSQKVKLDLWDTAGLDAYDGLRPYSFENAHAIILCFAIDSPSSFTNIIQRWHPQLCHYCPTVPIVLVGVKHSDLHAHNLSNATIPLPISIIAWQATSDSTATATTVDKINEDTTAESESCVELDVEIHGLLKKQIQQKENLKFPNSGDGDGDHDQQNKISDEIVKKCDKSRTCINRRKVTLSPGQGMALAAMINAASYIECSPNTHSGVNQVFTRAANLALKYGSGRKARKENKSKCSIA